MICADRDTLDSAGITAIAEHVASAQVRQIGRGIRQVMRRLGAVCPGVAVLAGAGTFVGHAAAEQTGLTPCDLADDVGTAAARSAPAAAVAYLLSEFVLTEGA
jgi:uncharacterized hydantoinase/oxoprolinase family protein